MRAFPLLLLLFAASRDASEQGNLLNIALGATVISRTAELTLDQSALRAIDGDPGTSWNSPPDDAKDQTLIFALAAVARIDKVGIKTPRAPLFRVKSLQVDSSLDNVTYSPLARIQLADGEDVQLFNVPPRELLYLRVTTLEAPGHFAKLDSIQVRGQFTQPIHQKPIDGCWSINGFPSSFTTEGGRTTGTIGGDHPVTFVGGSDGTVYRFIWTSGPDYGFGAIDTAPDGKHLSGLRWYVEPIEFSSAESWFGEKTNCGATARTAASGALAATQFFARAKRLPFYGTDEATADFLASLPRDKHYRLVSREFRQANAKQVAQQRLDSIKAAMQKRGVDPARFEWQAIGSDSPPRAIETEIQRVLYSVVELQP